MQSQPVVELRQGALRLEITPAVGGAISAFEWIGQGERRPILRQCPTPLVKVLDAACFPLVPFVNRIRGGTFAFGGRQVRIAPNMAGDPSPLHGQGWLNPWQVRNADSSRALLGFDHQAGEWPWSYEARQEFSLDQGGLSIAMSCRNTSSEPMPCGLGQHPYFPCGSETRIDTRVEDVWTIDEHVLPVARTPAQGRFDLNDRLSCGQDLDHGFGGWSGKARLGDPAWPYRVELSSNDAHFFQLYSPASGGIFVAEPVTHANAALNAPQSEWGELGLRVLEPGEEMAIAIRLDVLPI
ncbi:MAG: aldose 1-epimerase [Sphingomicrobium sp.]